MILTEAAAVTADGRISSSDLGIWKDAHIEPLSRIFRFLRENGSVPGMQLAHAGRKASTAPPWEPGPAPRDPEHGGWTPIYAPSALAFDSHYQVPQALSLEQINHIAQAFAEAARRAHAAGAQVIEIHAAHGYLLHEFLSPLANRRTDQYGGSFENRTRFLRETVEAIRRVWPDTLPLLVRISATDWEQASGFQGWTPEESVELACELKPLGVDMIDCSSGGNTPHPKIPIGAGYQVPFAARIRRDADIATGAVGMITEPMQADQIIRNGDADLVFMAREFLRHPYWPLHAAPQVHATVDWPKQYERAKPK